MQLEVARARYNVEDAATRVRLTQRSLSQAEENLQVSKNRFEVGMETLTNYMEAQAQWQKAWSDWIEAKAELRVNETYYLKSTEDLVTKSPVFYRILLLDFFFRCFFRFFQ